MQQSDTVRLIIKVQYPNGAEGWETYDIADHGLYDRLFDLAVGASAVVVGSSKVHHESDEDSE